MPTPTSRRAALATEADRLWLQRKRLASLHAQEAATLITSHHPQAAGIGLDIVPSPSGEVYALVVALLDPFGLALGDLAALPVEPPYEAGEHLTQAARWGGRDFSTLAPAGAPWVYVLSFVQLATPLPDEREARLLADLCLRTYSDDNGIRDRVCVDLHHVTVDVQRSDSGTEVHINAEEVPEEHRPVCITYQGEIHDVSPY
ncbi:MAG TPA: hypothetical protein VJT31_01895 [Rugosimonospora sp.]|nr:hypothetical protein [Rugosimonospora sp.]